MASNGEFLVPPKPVPSLEIPPSKSSVTVRVIDSTSQLTALAPMILEPSILGHEVLQCPSYSFLIEHPSGRKVLFDLGTRKDWENLPPLVQGLLKEHKLTIKVVKDVAEILEGNGISAADGAIEAVIWSHWHYDHIGDPQTFPSSTDLVVGPGFKNAFLPGYPLNQDAAIRQSDYEGRQLRELEFDALQKRIGGLQYNDYFGDGSFYVLNAPGHAVGHLCALARVTTGQSGKSEEDTFIFMGGDACHHGGEFRPTDYLPLPRSIKTTTMSGLSWNVCPGAWLREVHHEKMPNAPFYQVREGFSYNEDECKQTISNMTLFDGADNVLVVIAHDSSLLEQGFPMFPDKANDWRKLDFASRLRWCFIKDFKQAMKEAKNI